MFSFFKKTENTLKRDTELLANVFKKLPDRFRYLSNQLEEGIIVNVRKSDKPVPNFFNLSHNVELLNKYEDKDGRYFKITRIKVFDLNTNSYIDIVIHIGYGILLGYYAPGRKTFTPDINKIDTRNFIIEYFPNEDYDKLATILNANDLKLINPAEVYELELNGKVYYHLKDLENGDFIGVDTEKRVYKITHDPFEIVQFDRSLSEVIK